MIMTSSFHQFVAQAKQSDILNSTCKKYDIRMVLWRYSSTSMINKGGEVPE